MNTQLCYIKLYFIIYVYKIMLQFREVFQRVENCCGHKVDVVVRQVPKTYTCASYLA